MVKVELEPREPQEPEKAKSALPRRIMQRVGLSVLRLGANIADPSAADVSRVQHNGAQYKSKQTFTPTRNTAEIVGALTAAAIGAAIVHFGGIADLSDPYGAAMDGIGRLSHVAQDNF